jgi:hypothetical protein
MPLEQVQFQPNIPQVLRLKFDEPKLIEKTGNHMITLEDGRVVFLKPEEAAAFGRCGFRRGDAVRFTRIAVMQGNRIAGSRWEFLPAELAPEPAPPQAAKPEGGAVRSASSEVNRASQGQSITPAPSNGNSHATHNGVPYWDDVAEFFHCHQEALDLAARIEAEAAARGRPLHVSDDKVCEIGTALFIGRDRRRSWPGR